MNTGAKVQVALEKLAKRSDRIGEIFRDRELREEVAKAITKELEGELPNPQYPEVEGKVLEVILRAIERVEKKLELHDKKLDSIHKEEKDWLIEMGKELARAMGTVVGRTARELDDSLSYKIRSEGEVTREAIRRAVRSELAGVKGELEKASLRAWLDRSY